MKSSQSVIEFSECKGNERFSLSQSLHEFPPSADVIYDSGDNENDELLSEAAEDDASIAKFHFHPLSDTLCSIPKPDDLNFSPSSSPPDNDAEHSQHAYPRWKSLNKLQRQSIARDSDEKDVKPSESDKKSRGRSRSFQHGITEAFGTTDVESRGLLQTLEHALSSEEPTLKQLLIYCEQAVPFQVFLAVCEILVARLRDEDTAYVKLVEVAHSTLSSNYLPNKTVLPEMVCQYFPEFAKEYKSTPKGSRFLKQKQAESWSCYKRRHEMLQHFKSMDVAAALTCIEYEYIQTLSLRELLSKSWKQENKLEIAPSVCALVDRFNKVSLWVVDTILFLRSAAQRLSVFQKFIEICRKLLELRNYNTLGGIVGGLSCRFLKRDKVLWKRMPKQLRQQYKDLTDLLSPEANYAAYRRHILEAGTVVLPYMPVHLHDFYFADDHLRSYDPSENPVNMQMLHLGKMLEEIQAMIQAYHNVYSGLTCGDELYFYFNSFPGFDFNVDRLNDSFANRSRELSGDFTTLKWQGRSSSTKKLLGRAADEASVKPILKRVTNALHRVRHGSPQALDHKSRSEDDFNANRERLREVADAALQHYRAATHERSRDSAFVRQITESGAKGFLEYSTEDVDDEPSPVAQGSPVMISKAKHTPHASSSPAALPAKRSDNLTDNSEHSKDLAPADTNNPSKLVEEVTSKGAMGFLDFLDEEYDRHMVKKSPRPSSSTPSSTKKKEKSRLKFRR